MKSKHDYDGPDFCKTIEALARGGFTDKEIAMQLNLESKTFSKMKNGHCRFWTQEQNSTRSKRIKAALSKGRLGIVAMVRAAYLKAALGGKTLKSVVKEYITTLDAGGNPVGDRVLHSMAERWQEQRPNMHALSRWLCHYDTEWRKAERSPIAKMRHGDQEVDNWIAENTTVNYQKTDK